MATGHNFELEIISHQLLVSQPTKSECRAKSDHLRFANLDTNLTPEITYNVKGLNNIQKVKVILPWRCHRQS